MTSLSEDSYRPPTRHPSAFDQSIRADLDLAAGLLTLLATKEPKAEELANDATELASHVLLLDRDTKTTVLDRIRQATRGIPAASYGPRGSEPNRCTLCDDTGWLEAEHETRCTNPECEAFGGDNRSSTDDMLTVVSGAKGLPSLATKAIQAHRAEEPIAWKTLHRSVSELRHVFANYPPAARGGDERTQRQLERENIRSAPDCPSCADIGHPCPVEQYDQGGYTATRELCQFCRKWAPREQDPNHEGWPARYLVAMHADDHRAQLLSETHVDRRRWEAKAKPKGTAA